MCPAAPNLRCRRALDTLLYQGWRNGGRLPRQRCRKALEAWSWPGGWYERFRLPRHRCRQALSTAAAKILAHEWLPQATARALGTLRQLIIWVTASAQALDAARR